MLRSTASLRPSHPRPGTTPNQVSVLDSNQLSPVTIIAYTNVELYSISKEKLHAQHASFNVDMVNFLNESMMMHNPPQQKIAQYLRNRLRWERNKSKILANMMPPKARSLNVVSVFAL